MAQFTSRAPGWKVASVKLTTHGQFRSTMQIVVNGEPHDYPTTLTISQLVERLSLREQRLAVELNGEIVPRSRWPEILLNQGDRTEIVRAIGGG